MSHIFPMTWRCEYSPYSSQFVGENTGWGKPPGFTLERDNHEWGPVFAFCYNFGHNQNLAGQKAIYGYIKLIPQNGVLPIEMCDRAKTILTNSQRPSFSLPNMVTRMVISARNLSAAKSPLDEVMARQNYRSDVIQLWEYYGVLNN